MPCSVETVGAFGDKIDVRAVAKNFPGGAAMGMEAFDATYPAAAQGRAVHDEGVELHFAVAVQKAATAGVKGFVILEYDHGFDRVQSGAAAFQRAPSGRGGIAHANKVRLDHVVGNGPGAAVYHQNRIAWHFQSFGESCGISVQAIS